MAGGWIEDWLPSRKGEDAREGHTWVFESYLLPTYGSTLVLPPTAEGVPTRRWLELVQLYSAAVFHAVGQLVGMHVGLSSPQTAPEFWVSTIVMVAGTVLAARSRTRASRSSHLPLPIRLRHSAHRPSVDVSVAGDLCCLSRGHCVVLAGARHH